MARVTGIGGIFFKSEKPKEMHKWYVKNLKIPAHSRRNQHVRVVGCGDPTQWDDGVVAFPRDTKYFGASPSNFMINYLVDNLDELLEESKQAGVTMDPKRQDHEWPLRVDH
jgi:hypothetical protein